MIPSTNTQPGRTRACGWRSLIAAVCTLCLTFAVKGQTVIYVNANAPAGGNGQTWATAYRDLQQAIAAAAAVGSSVQVWVVQGTYTPQGTDPESTFSLYANVQLLGGFAGGETKAEQRDPASHVTVLSGDRLHNDPPFGYSPGNLDPRFSATWLVVARDDNFRHVVSAIGCPRSGVLDGFLISGGHSIGGAAQGQGGGLYVSGQGSSPTIRNCTFFANYAHNGGAGMWIKSGCSARIEACRFAGNYAYTRGGGLEVGDGGSPGAGNDTEVISSFFSGNAAGNFGSGMMIYGNRAVVAGCTFSGNMKGDSGSWQGGVSLDVDVGGSVQAQNTIFWEGAQTQYGVVAVFGGPITYDSCFGFNELPTPQFANLAGTDGIVGTPDDDPRLTAQSPCVDTGNSAVLLDNNYIDAVHNFRLADGNGDGVWSPDIGAAEFGSGGFQPTLYVRATGVGYQSGFGWANALTGQDGIQRAIAICANANGMFTNIWVAAGTYKPTTYTGPASRSVSFELQNNLGIYGGFQGNETSLSQRTAATIAANPTILSGDLLGDDIGSLNRGENSYNVVTSFVQSGLPVLDGFTIMAGSSIGGGTGGGGGIGIGGFGNSGRARIANCKVYSNQAGSGGGGVYVTNGSHAEFSDITFDGNICGSLSPFGGAVLVDLGSDVRVDRCNFVRNLASGGGGVALRSGSIGKFARCTFDDNHGDLTADGGALFIDSGCTGETVNCVFTRNSAFNAGGVLAGGVFYCTNGLFTNNVSVGAGGRASAVDVMPTGTAVLTNCTIAGNRSTNAAVSDLGSLTLRNSVIWGNSSATYTDRRAQVTKSVPATLLAAYSNVSDWDLGGIGMDATDPQFTRVPSNGPDFQWGTVDDDLGDLRLVVTSPAIDSGDALSVPTDGLDLNNNGNLTESVPFDLAGNNRFFDDQSHSNTGNGSPPVDRGAYENNLATTRWNVATGGVFTDGSKWSDGVPNSSVRAVFDDSHGVNNSFTVTFPSHQNAYSLSVLANEIKFNFKSSPGTGSMFLHAPGNDANNPCLLIGMDPGRDARLLLRNSSVTVPVTVTQSLETTNAVIAGGINSLGRLEVEGLRANFGATGAVDVGRVGAGVLSLLDQSLADIETLRVGTQVGATGTVTLTGSGPLESTILYGGATGTGSMVVGDAGAGSVSLTGTSLLGSGFAQEVVLGSQATGVGNVSLMGPGAVWSSAQNRFIVGDAGQGTITVTGGAQLLTSTGGEIVIGRQADSIGHVTVGSGSSWIEEVQQIQVGGEGTGRLTIEPGATVNCPSGVAVNEGGTLDGAGTIIGSGTSGLFNAGTVLVNGTMTVNGKYRQFPQASGEQAGRLEMEVAGTNTGEFDRLTIAGEAELGGGLIVRLANGYVPDPQQTLNLPLVVPTSIALNRPRFDVSYTPLLLNQSKYLRVKYPLVASDGLQLELGDLGFLFNPGGVSSNPLARPPLAAAVGDFDNTNGPDLAVAIPGEPASQPGELVVFLNQGVSGGNWLGFTTALTFPVGVNPVDLVAEQMDGVGGSDLVVVNKGSSSVSVLSTIPNGPLLGRQTNFVTQPSPVSVAVAPFRLDVGGGNDRPDLVVAIESNNTVQVYATDDSTNPQFNIWGVPVNLPSQPPRPRVVRPSTVDGDKRRDIVVAMCDGPGSHGDVVAIYHTDDDASMTGIGVHAVGDEPVALVIRDIDGDGSPGAPGVEIVTANEGDGTISVLASKRNRIPTDPFFNPAVNLPIEAAGFDAVEVASIDAGDVDGDSDIDLAVIGVNGSGSHDVFVIRNDTTDENSRAMVLSQPLAMDQQNSPALVRISDVDPASPTGGGTEDIIGINGGTGLLPQDIRTITSQRTPTGCDSLDFNGDTLFPDTADIDDFLSVFSGGSCSNDPNCGDLDFNNDSLFPDTLDIDSLLSVFSGGPCLQ